jgi:hypothetical protein
MVSNQKGNAPSAVQSQRVGIRTPRCTTDSSSTVEGHGF